MEESVHLSLIDKLFDVELLERNLRNGYRIRKNKPASKDFSMLRVLTKCFLMKVLIMRVEFKTF